MAASRHTHASCNAVPLVWGSLRLAPIILTITWWPLLFPPFCNCLLLPCPHNSIQNHAEMSKSSCQEALFHEKMSKAAVQIIF